LTLDGFVKYMSFPLSNYLQYGVLRLFSKGIETSYISDGITIWFPWNVKIGKRSSLNQGVIIDGYGHVSIGEGVRVASYVNINPADHQYDDPEKMIVDKGFVVEEVIIGDDVAVGCGTIINKGVRMGKGSVIGSGAVLTKDIPGYSIAAGVPCRMIKKELNGSGEKDHTAC